MATKKDEENGKYGYYIICKRRSHKTDYALNFWGPNYCGYTFDVNTAGVYTQEEVDDRFPKDHYGDDQPVSVSKVDRLSEFSVIDHSKLGRIVRNTTANREAVGMKFTEMRSGGTIWDSRAFCDPKYFADAHEKTMRILEEITSKGLV